MNINEFGQVTVSEQEAFEALYSGKIKNLEGIYVDDISVIEQYNRSKNSNADEIPKLASLEILDIDPKFFHRHNQQDWFLPKNYCPNLIKDLYALCRTEEQIKRVTQELELFTKHDMIDLLFYLKYLVDTMRQNNIVWGVGRGSSVASYVLYLLGVHRIDSLKYDLDIGEFLK